MEMIQFYSEIFCEPKTVFKSKLYWFKILKLSIYQILKEKSPDRPSCEQHPGPTPTSRFSLSLSQAVVSWRHSVLCLDSTMILEVPLLRGSGVLSPVRAVYAKIPSAHVSPVGIMSTFLLPGWKQKPGRVVTVAFRDDIRAWSVQGPQLWGGLGSNGSRESAYDRIPNLKDYQREEGIWANII